MDANRVSPAVAFVAGGALVSSAPRAAGTRAVTTAMHANRNATEVAAESALQPAAQRRPRASAPPAEEQTSLPAATAPATYTVTVPHPSPLVLGEDPTTGAVVIAAIDRAHPSAPLFRVGDRVLSVDGRIISDIVKERDSVADSTYDVAVRMMRASAPPSSTLTLSRGPPSPEVKVPKRVPAMPARDTVEELLSPSPLSKSNSFQEDDAWSLTAGGAVMGKKERNLELVIQSWRQSRSETDRLELVSCASRLLREYGLDKEPGKIVSLYYRLRRFEVLAGDCKILNNVMIALGDCRKWKRAKEIWSETADLTKNVECYTTYIKVLSRLGELNNAMAVIPDMRKQGVNPTTRSYNALIAACVSGKSLETARSIFGEMMYDGLKPDVVSWNILLNWHATNGPDKFKAAQKTFEDMLQSGVRPNEVTLTTLVKSACRDQQMDQAENLINRMPEFGISPDIGAYNQVIRGYSDKMQWRKALDCFEDVCGQKGLANHITYSLAVAACAKAGQLERAESTLASMIRSGFEPGLQTYVSLLSGYSRVGAVNRAYSLLREMRSRGCEPDKKILTSFMNTCLEAGEPDLALTVFTKMKKMGMVADTVSLTLIMRAFAQRGDIDKAFDVLRSMRRKDNSHKPSSVTYNEFILAAKSCGSRRLAQAALQMMLADQKAHRRSSGSPVIKFDRNTFSSLTCGTSVGEDASEEIDYLVEVMNIMKENGMRPNGQIYAALLYTCLQANEEDIGETIMAERSFSVAPRDQARVRELESRLQTKLGVESRFLP